MFPSDFSANNNLQSGGASYTLYLAVKLGANPSLTGRTLTLLFFDFTIHLSLPAHDNDVVLCFKLMLTHSTAGVCWWNIIID